MSTLRGGQQGADKLEFAQLSAGQRDDVLVQDRRHVEHPVEATAQAGRVLGDLVQQGSYRGCVLVYVVLVPALLVVIRSILLAIGVAEGDEAQLLADEALLCGRAGFGPGVVEVVPHFVTQQRIVSGDDFHQAALA